jgi:hypothetical protein
MNGQAESGRGTLKAPKFYDGPEHSGDDVHLRAKLFTYETSDGVVGGYEIGAMFKINAPAALVWPQFKDWNLWQGHYHYYSAPPGDLYSDEQLDLGTETFRIGAKGDGGLHGKLGGTTRDGKYETDDYVVLRVIPEHLIVIFQPVPNGKGAVSPGFHSFLLHEHGDGTTIAGHMEHAMLFARDKPEEELLEVWRNGSGGTVRFWHELFIPELRRRVAEG